jgi:hypothetical protein
MEKKNSVDIKNTLVNLKIIGQLDNNMKLNTRNKIFIIDENTWTQGLYRLARRDDRECTLREIGLLIRDVSCIVNSLNENESIYEISEDELNEYIQNGITGLNKLRETYNLDKTTTARLEYEIETLEKIRKSMIKSKIE